MAEKEVNELDPGTQAQIDAAWIEGDDGISSFKFQLGGGGVPIKQHDSILLQNQQTSGTDGGTNANDAWTTLVLNTEVLDEGDHCTLAANQFTLAAGTYKTNIRSPFFEVDRVKLRVRNITDSSDAMIGESSYVYSSGGEAILEGEFTITTSKVFELQYWANFPRATLGLGVATSAGVIEIYAQVRLEKKYTVVGGDSGSSDIEVAIFEDVRAAGVVGGAGTVGIRNTRTLQTTSALPSWASRDGNKMVIDTGTYLVEGSAAAFNCGCQFLFLRRLTATAADEAISETSYPGADVNEYARFRTKVIVEGDGIEYQLESVINSTAGGTSVFGLPRGTIVTPNLPEKYASVKWTKIG